MTRIVRLAILAVLVPLAACEEEFDPYIIDGIYSINGYLDAAADTQWVRVTPIRTSILTTPDPVDAVVTLEHLGTGRIVEMTQSVFTFPSPNFAGASAFAHNFWTTEPIERGASYRLIATRSDGESSTAIVRIPRGMGEAQIAVNLQSLTGAGDSVQVVVEVPAGDEFAIFGLAHFLPVPHPCQPSGRPYDLELFPFHAGRPMGPVSYRSPRLLRAVVLPDPSCVGREPPETYAGWELWIGFSGERWPFSPGDAIGYLGQGSNIQNGRGYLGGIALEKVRLPFCGYSGGCDLYFGPGSATVDVTLVADGVPVEFPAEVRLRKGEEGSTRTSDHKVIAYGEPTPFPPFTRPQHLLWNAPPTIARFPGLEPGAYRVEVPVSSLYYCEERSIVLAPGEHRSIEIVRVNRFQFPNEPVNARGCREG